MILYGQKRIEPHNSKQFKPEGKLQIYNFLETYSFSFFHFFLLFSLRIVTIEQNQGKKIMAS